MDWLTFIANMTGHIAWPLVIVVLLVIVRRELASLAARLTEFTFPGGSAKFREALARAEQIPLPPSPQLPSAPNVNVNENASPIAESAPPKSDWPFPWLRNTEVSKSDRAAFEESVLLSQRKYEDERIKKVAAESPSAAIIIAFADLEDAVGTLGSLEGSSGNLIKVIADLHRKGAIPSELGSVITELQQARNAVAHSLPARDAISTAEALMFVERANAAAEQIQRIVHFRRAQKAERD